MATDQRKLLVTTALPYANGSMHLGHMLEQVQTDIWARYQRMRGHDVHFVCADDAHGTPIMLSARAQNIDPETLIQHMSKKQQRDFAGFHISHDHYHSTHSEENRQFVRDIYLKLRDRGYIKTRTIEQLYDPQAQMFLPDRFVKGTCPRCQATDQYGDNCDVCGANYTPRELINAVSVISGATPTIRESEHYFFDLPQFETTIKNWLNSDAVQPEARHKVSEWFDMGLKSWDISRDAPYFGFEIPDAPGKYFYVWLDAPIGYISSFFHYCQKKTTIDFNEFWGQHASAEVHHFIGKDIVNFHCLFWPAMLSGIDYQRPTRVNIHGYVTLNGQKMSKSKKGTFITAEQYLRYLDPEYLRYYYATKLNSHIEDIDLNTDDFIQRVNTDIINKVVNLAARNAGFIHKRFNDQLSDLIARPALFQEFVCAGEAIATYYEQCEYSRAMREISKLADKANQYIDTHAPWVLAKDAKFELELHQVCSMGLNLFRVLMVYLKPVMPQLVKRAEAFFNQTFTWENRCQALTHHTLSPFKPLLSRIDPKDLEKMMTSEPESLDVNAQQTDNNIEPIKDTIDFDTFAKIDLRVAEIIDAQAVPEAKKLIQLKLDIGTNQCQVFAGIKSAYEPEELIGKLIVVVANLAPRKMRFGLSEGMILTAGPGGEDIWILEPNPNTQPGMRVG